MHELGRFIQDLMDQEGMTQAELGRRSGLSRQHISLMLGEGELKRIPDSRTLAALAAAFRGVGVEAFIMRAAAATGLPVGEGATVDYSAISNETLIAILRERLGGSDAGNAEAEKSPDSSPARGGR